MLRLINIKKNYEMKYQEPVRALRGVTLNFRRNEFVAVLGPSGCGKTTLLNIIGGLDRYSDGDLIIKNKSTKNYTDRDWDTYRNHSVGFVFQAYNLIGHQSICKNVELALTIAGVSPKERKERAYAALEKVGLKGMEKKKPNQLSGGQMQRVAIARALVNNPEILLADEPTGALDSETSVQIMDLLKEVAEDRLVIMVTHNPDLAEKYATRIVNMFDGEVKGDSNPYTENEEKKEVYKAEEEVNKGSKKKSSMSFLTATSLSIANLFSKSKRTILVAIAGSIGIFGVSTVLAASTGVNMYIHDMQDDMLSSYPLTIAEEAVDYSSLMTGLYSNTDSKIKDFDIKTRVGLNSMVDYLMDKYTDIMSVKTNTIDDDLVEFVKEIPEEYVSALSFNYGIDPTNNIFTDWSYKVPETGATKECKISLNGLTQRYIGELQTVEGFEQYAQYVDLFTDFMLLMPGEQDYILQQYDLLGENAHFPQNENEIMLVVEGDQTLTDLVFAQMGYYQEEELMNIAKKAIKKYDETTPKEELDQLDTLYPYRSSFTFDELMSKKLTYYPHNTIYGNAPKELADSAYNEYSVALLADTDSNGENDEFYVVSYSDNSTFTNMFDAIIYNGMNLSLISNEFESVYLIKMKHDFYPSDPLNSPLIAAFSNPNAKFSDFLASPEEDLDPTTGTFVCIPSDKALAMIGGSKMSASDYASFSIINIESGDDTTATVTSQLQNIVLGGAPVITSFTANKEKTEQTEITAYQYPAEAEASWGEGTELKIAGILKPKKDVQFGCLRRGVYYTKAFQTKYMNDNKNSEFVKHFESFMEDNNGQRKKAEMYNAYVTFNYPDYSDPDHPVTASGYASCLNGDLNSSFSSLFSKITGVDYGAENETHFRSISGLKQLEIPVIDPNTGAQTGVDFEYRDNLPVKMSIYPVNFQFKDKVNNYLDQWNEKVDITLYKGTAQEKVLHFDDRMELTYTDTISMIIAVINTMITIITTALVIFTSLSLVVSSFMIAVITYISVMERVKEIGVIRSLGGRKRDVSRLFIAENLVTGTLSGIIGLVITGIVCIIINLAIAPFGVPNIAVLTPLIMVIMLGLSIVLSVVAGLIPSLHASRQDPVIALRSE
ncbi:MAG: ABC transporter ATP-binding protein/permease [Bacilli bacterium]|nr:ABC transporter ATP-binding protein/permease [Bacilli bacterium]